MDSQMDGRTDGWMTRALQRRVLGIRQCENAPEGALKFKTRGEGYAPESALGFRTRGEGYAPKGAPGFKTRGEGYALEGALGFKTSGEGYLSTYGCCH
eukprot:365885-Chlamydomonas_euryale.AAC.13